MPVTKLSHGCYSWATTFSATQHAYAGAPTGYIEALEISDCPDGRHPIVFLRYGGRTHTYWFIEFATAADASREVHRVEWSRGGQDAEEFYSARPGFIRYVELEPGQLPWFYAADKEMVTPDCDFVISG